MSRTALILAAHGSHHSATSGDSARRHAAALRELGRFDQVEAVFWKEFPSLRDARYLVEAETVVVVPLFMANGYFADRVVPRELELAGPVTRRDRQTWHYAEPIGTDPRLIDVVLHRAAEAVGADRPLAELTLLLLGHGTVQNRRSEQTVLDHAERLRERGLFAAVAPAFLDSEPSIPATLAGCPTEGIVAVPMFVSDGRHPDRDIPALLGLERDGRAWRQPTARAGRRIWYARAVGSDPALIDVILHRADECLRPAVSP